MRKAPPEATADGVAMQEGRSRLSEVKAGRQAGRQAVTVLTYRAILDSLPVTNPPLRDAMAHDNQGRGPRHGKNARRGIDSIHPGRGG